MVGSGLRQTAICRSREVEFGIVGTAGAASGAVRIAARAELAGDVSSDTADAGVVARHRGILLSGCERPALVMDGQPYDCAHYFTDHFDGKLGKYRNTGLCKWGFYMDHLFDYGFLCSILIGYTLLIPEGAFFNMLLVLCVFSGFMFHTYLMLAATEEFKVSFSRFGPTEMRIGLIVCNALIVKFGVRPLKGALPYIALGGTVAIIVMAYQAQKKLWRIDMEAKNAKLES